MAPLEVTSLGQSMSSAGCSTDWRWRWKRSRYMHSVPEENMISQVQHNKEVTLSLVPDYRVLEVKDLLVHMGKNLSSLENEEKMLSDESYSRIDASLGSGSGYSGSSIDSNELTIDDEDNVDDSNRMYSGSGSGDFGTYDYGPDNTNEEDYSQFSAEIRPDSTGKPTRGPGSDTGRGPAPDRTSKQEKGKDSNGNRKPSGNGKNSGRDGSMDRDSASTTTMSLTLLLAVAFTSCVFGGNKAEWIMQMLSPL
ncbi:hypothetical protein PoB_004299200 [Plakobranchus ocellatus]|uniref:Uncharacterized protein n=1 Tax=Plakobranchus ocellatus TaxID=259542 RepID=A0AAV4BBI7_9GAST|nr:hypothetical protein PoB_004299200 [Plakobranchus ocellatus]